MSKSYNFILSSDNEDVIFILKKIRNKTVSEDFSKLLIDLVNSNDIITLNNVIEYCEINKDCSIINILSKKVEELYSIPSRDSTWSVKLNSIRFRESNVDMLYLPRNPKKCLDKLLLKCD